jgi:PhnB protein
VTEGAVSDRLDLIIDAVLKRGDATRALSDRELAPLARLAAHLRHYPGPEFKARLREYLERMTVMSAALVTPHVREGFTTITPYLRVKDAGLVDFLTRVFGAEETHVARGGAGGMHREVRVGNSMLMIGEGGDERVVPVRPSALHVYVEDVATTFERALGAGAASLGAPEDRPYGERSGFVRDPFGNHWYIATHLGESHVPEGLRTLTPFVHARDASRYLEFLKGAFAAVEEGRHEADGRVRYARLRIGNAAIELGEAEGGAEPMPSGFYLYVGDADMLYEQALAAGAQSLWPPTDQPYGDRVAGVEDPMGNQWFIARPA